MRKFGANEIREMFLDFFKNKDHLILPSFSLIPEKDRSLLLINAGMAPLKPYFTGQEVPPKKRIATCQKCVRTADIERVGKTTRHATFFEMLGNFSFGDYFKKEAILWAWEFVTEHLKLPVDRLWVTIYKEDDEAFRIWNNDVGMPADRIIRMGKEDNFWEIGVGPCGPCSEIYFDRGKDKGCGRPDCGIGCDCDRFVEFWNLVFTQFDKDEKGNYNRLAHPNIDTGMGLERIAAIVQGVDSLFEIDTVRNITKAVSDLAGVQYGDDEKKDVSLRVITDHIRGATFMVCDGVVPSNEGRGYVLRRILRRAARHGRLLGIESNFLSDIASTVISEFSEAYPELNEKKDYILQIIKMEEERFRETIEQGLTILKDYIEEIKARGQKHLSGNKAFQLYDTYGFPLDLTKEILGEEGLTVDEEGFAKEMEIQRTRARAARQETDYMGMDDKTYKLIQKDIVTEFKGYETLETESTVRAIIKDNEEVEVATEEDNVFIVLDRTPFYGESGGQVGDRGVLENTDVTVIVEDTQKIFGNRIVHKGRVVRGKLCRGDTVRARVDREKRMATARNHSAVHLLHSALKVVLGSHVNQAGSLVDSKRLRFDFSHFAPMTREELTKVEKLVNEKIMEGLKIEVFETTLNEARKLGAIALFGEKYGDRVRVVKMGDFSIELCGGTHLSNTGQAGMFKIVSETGVAAGVRRIEAVTGMNTYKYFTKKEELLSRISRKLKTDPDSIEQRIDAFIKQMKDYEKEIDRLRKKVASTIIDDIIKNKKKAGEVSFVTARIDEQNIEGLRELADLLRNKMKSGVVVLASVYRGKVQFVAAATRDVVEKGIHVGNLIREVAKTTGGGGGGRPDMAQAGGRDTSKIKEALEKVESLISQQLA